MREPSWALRKVVEVLAAALGVSLDAGSTATAPAVAEASLDKRRKVEGEVVNFFVHYEIDDNTSKHVLSLDEYGGENPSAWVLLEAVE